MFSTLRLDQKLFLLLVISLPIVQPFNLRFGEIIIPLSDPLFVVTSLVWFVALLRKKTSFRWSKFYLPLAIYFLALVVSTFTSEQPRQSFFKLAGAIYLICLAVLTFNLVRSLDFFRKVLSAWMIGTVLTIIPALLAIVLFYVGYGESEYNIGIAGYGSLPPGNYPRVLGLFANMNMLSDYLNVSLVFLLLMYELDRLRPVWSRILLIAIGITSVFTFSPGIGGIFLSAGLWVWLKLKETNRQRLGQVALYGGIVMAVLFFLATTISPISTGQQGFKVPVFNVHLEPSTRAIAWKTAWTTFTQHPVFGRGVGMEVSDVRMLHASGIEHHLTDAHNAWLSVAGQAGLFGLLAFISIIIYLIRVSKPFRLNGPVEGKVRTALLLAFIGAFLYQSLSGSFEDARHLWLLFGLMAAFEE